MFNKLLTWVETKKNLTIILTLGFCIGIYLLSNRITPFLTPHYLPLSFVDRMIPFIPTSVWLYEDVLLLNLAAAYLSKDNRNLTRFFCAQVSATIIGVGFFMLFPTIFPRMLYPMTNNIDHVTSAYFNLIRKLDNPTNCLPSLHVCYSYGAAFLFRQEQQKKFLLFLILATLIAISTLTTKQHYFLDVLGGMALAYFCYRLFLYFYPTELTIKEKSHGHSSSISQYS